MPNEEFPPQPAPARYVPTLTEVVVDTAQPAAGAPAAPAVSAGVTAEQVLALLGPELDRRISEAIAQALHEQMLGLHAGCAAPWPTWCRTPWTWPCAIERAARCRDKPALGGRGGLACSLYVLLLNCAIVRAR
ncbi:hypothetical protein ACFSTJ_20495 [Ottowia pentelensis]|uniref:hypothetical protein n=1 Tax=Ottowia pentelensis TaxID=511108 RepID=UPI00363AD3BD